MKRRTFIKSLLGFLAVPLLPKVKEVEPIYVAGNRIPGTDSYEAIPFPRAPGFGSLPMKAEGTSICWSKLNDPNSWDVS